MPRAKLRFVFDTNVLVSALLRPGSIPEQALRHTLTTGILLISPETFGEIVQVLSRPKFDAYVSADEREDFANALIDGGLWINVSERIRVSADPKDDRFLELAVAGSADYLVTGDRKHLHGLGSFRGTRIVTARELLDLL